MSTPQKVPKELTKLIKKLSAERQICYRLYHDFNPTTYCFEKELFYSNIDLERRRASLARICNVQFKVSYKHWGEAYGADEDGYPIKWPIDPKMKVVVKYPDGDRRHISQQYLLK